LAKPLIDLTEAEIKMFIARRADSTGFAYNGFVAELDRRTANRQERASFVLSVVGLVIAVVALVVTAIRA
jgi:hypothetical protein